MPHVAGQFQLLTSKITKLLCFYMGIFENLIVYRKNGGMTLVSNASYLIGCDNVLAKLHTSHPDACDKVGGVIIMHIDDLQQFAILWLHKTEEVRADKAHYATNITGDIYESGWISEMYGYSFGAAEVFF